MLRKTKNILESDFTSIVPEIADSLPMSYNTFRKNFEKTYGISPSLYRQNARIDHAKQLLSNKIYCAKPDPLFFETILMAEGVSPEEAFFTDDRKENCQAASAVGIQAVQFLSPEDLESHWSRYF